MNAAAACSARPLAAASRRSAKRRDGIPLARFASADARPTCDVAAITSVWRRQSRETSIALDLAGVAAAATARRHDARRACGARRARRGARLSMRCFDERRADSDETRAFGAHRMRTVSRTRRPAQTGAARARARPRRQAPILEHQPRHVRLHRAARGGAATIVGCPTSSATSVFKTRTAERRRGMGRLAHGDERCTDIASGARRASVPTPRRVHGEAIRRATHECTNVDVWQEAAPARSRRDAAAEAPRHRRVGARASRCCDASSASAAPRPTGRPFDRPKPEFGALSDTARSARGAGRTGTVRARCTKSACAFSRPAAVDGGRTTPAPTRRERVLTAEQASHWRRRRRSSACSSGA